MPQKKEFSYIAKNLLHFQKLNGVVPNNSTFLNKQAFKGYRKNFPISDNRRPITI